MTPTNRFSRFAVVHSDMATNTNAAVNLNKNNNVMVAGWPL